MSVEEATVLDFNKGGQILPAWIIKIVEEQYVLSRDLGHKGQEFTKSLEGKLIAEAGYQTFILLKGVFNGSR